jgi:peptide/nickel transport system ATP-binding protein
MRQRVMIAMALACNPKVLIADEPTTALDVTIQAQILDLMRDLKTRLGSAIMLITHDLGVVAEMARARGGDVRRPQGRGGPVERPVRRPLHPYTRGLMGAVYGPGLGGRRRELRPSPRRDRCPRRRVGLRQIDDRQDGAAADRAHVGLRVLDGEEHH